MPAPRTLEHKGKSYTLKEWADIRGIPKNRLLQRLHMGWSVGQVLGFDPSPSAAHRDNKAQVLSERVAKRVPKFSRGVVVDGILAPLRQHCTRLGVPYSVVYQRVRAGWELEQALSTALAKAG